MGEDVDSDEDLTKELEPLAYYVSDRKRVLREALRTLKGKRLEAMIPPTLKSWERPRLEAACLNILEDIDDEDLIAILDGRAGTANVAAVEQQEPAKEKSKKMKSKLKKIKSAEEKAELEAISPKKKKKKKAVITEEIDDESKTVKKKKKLLKAKKIKQKLKKKKKAAATAAAPTAADGEPSAAAPHKSLMELLELEYRAKAIKALLRSQGQTIPDIPMNVEGEEDEEIDAGPVAVESTKEPASKKTISNGPATIDSALTTTSKSTGKAKISTALSTPTTNTSKPAPDSTTPSLKKLSNEATSSAKSSVPRSSKTGPQKQLLKEEPKKAVIDLIDDALNTSFSEITGVQGQGDASEITHPSVIKACATKMESGTEEDLRSKLLRKYEQQKQEAEKMITVAEPVKKKRKKRKPKESREEEEDILDLHPQELSLIDEERGNTNEDIESSEEEDDDEDESETEENVVAEPQGAMQKPGIIIAAEVQEEELIYDDTEEEEEEEETEIALNEDRLNLNDENSNLSSQENQLWATVEEGNQVEKKVEVKKDENVDDDDNCDSSQEEGPQPPSRKIPVENSTSGVFENAVEITKGKSSGKGFGKPSLFARKLTLRIDPARIKALEEESAKEEAKREEERKKVEEEERLRRLAEEPEEGEIDSNEENYLSGDDLEKKADRHLERSHDKDKEKSRSPTPSRNSLVTRGNRSRSHSDKSEADSDEDSEDSSSYYGRRRPYKRKNTSPNRDFGKYSPKRAMESSMKKTEEDLSKNKRPTSPVDFITQYSDVEDISDDSNQSQPQQIKKIGPVQGCAQKPPDVASDSEHKQENFKSSSADVQKKREDPQDTLSAAIKSDAEGSEDEEENEDELSKPVTWYERWAQSHGMSKVVKANKIHRKVKSKLKQVRSANKKQPEVPKVPEPSVEAEPIIGSIEEYEKLFGKKVVVKSTEKEEDDSSKSNSNDDDEDADDLWGDIIGGS